MKITTHVSHIKIYPLSVVIRRVVFIRYQTQMSIPTPVSDSLVDWVGDKAIRHYSLLYGSPFFHFRYQTQDSRSTISGDHEEHRYLQVPS
jgi:hypothetical protein